MRRWLWLLPILLFIVGFALPRDAAAQSSLLCSTCPLNCINYDQESKSGDPTAAQMECNAGVNTGSADFGCYIVGPGGCPAGCTASGGNCNCPASHCPAANCTFNESTGVCQCAAQCTDYIDSAGHNYGGFHPAIDYFPVGGADAICRQWGIEYSDPAWNPDCHDPACGEGCTSPPECAGAPPPDPNDPDAPPPPGIPEYCSNLCPVGYHHPEAAVVQAIRSGTIVFNCADRGQCVWPYIGYMVVEVEDDGPYKCYMRYMHMDEETLGVTDDGSTLHEGDFVMGGQQLGYVDEGGAGSGPHLHVDMCCGPRCPFDPNNGNPRYGYWGGDEGGKSWQSAGEAARKDFIDPHDYISSSVVNAGGACPPPIHTNCYLNSANQQGDTYGVGCEGNGLGALEIYFAEITEFICHDDFYPPEPPRICECSTCLMPSDTDGALSVKNNVLGSLPNWEAGSGIHCYITKRTEKIEPNTIPGGLSNYYYLTNCYDQKDQLATEAQNIEQILANIRGTYKNCRDAAHAAGDEAAAGCDAQYLEPIASYNAELERIYNRQNECENVLSVSSDQYDEYYKASCYNNFPRPGGDPVTNRNQLGICIDNHIEMNKALPIIKKNNALPNVDETWCQQLTIKDIADNPHGYPPYERIYEYRHPWAPRDDVVPYPDGTEVCTMDDPVTGATLIVPAINYKDRVDRFAECEASTNPPVPHDICCNLLKEHVPLENMLEIRPLEELDPNKPPYKTWEPQNRDGYPTEGGESYYFTDSEDASGAEFTRAQPWVQHWDFGTPHCDGWNDAVVGLGAPNDNCRIGGWEEMKLYQARCYSHFNIRCMCDYEKTFKLGSAEEYVLRRAGAYIKAGNYGISLNDTGKMLRAERKENWIWPLSWRGYVTDDRPPQRFPNLYTQGSSSLLTNLDNALPGDIIIWDRDVVGDTRLPHVAYVVYADTAAYCAKQAQIGRGGRACTGRLVIAEMNFGKFPDMCGNTDRWNVETYREVYKPGAFDTLLATNRLQFPPDLSPGGAGYTAYSCSDPSLKRCREEYWGNVKIFRPRNPANVHRPPGSPLDNLPPNQRDDEQYVEIALQERDLGYDPPLSWRPGSEGIPVGSVIATNLAKLDVVEEAEVVITNISGDATNADQLYQGYDIHTAGTPGPLPPPGSSGGGSGGGPPPPTGSQLVGLNCNDTPSWPGSGGTALTLPSCSFSFNATSGTHYYSISEIIAGNWPARIDPNSFPEGIYQLAPPNYLMCAQPTPDACIDAPICFTTPSTQCESVHTLCDYKGYKRKTGDPDHPLYAPDDNDTDYRNTGYGRDYVVDYLYYVNEFLQPQHISTDHNPNNIWMRQMSNEPPIQWLQEYWDEFSWIESPFMTLPEYPGDSGQLILEGRIIWKMDSSATARSRMLDEFDSNYTPGASVGIFVSDEYFRGQVGIIVNHNGNTVDVASTNWLQQSASCSNRLFDKHNCYQIYGTFGEPCIARNIPIENFAVIFNPVVGQ